jgi:[pyruvate, water dikinase]-phosphate phosphotransferase / [pyruvate, water dikinase] kinase
MILYAGDASTGGLQDSGYGNFRCRTNSRLIPVLRSYTRADLMAIATNSTMGRFHLHLVSDSTGETIRSVARACMVQFDGVNPIEHLWPMARTASAMDRVLEDIATHPGLVIFTLVDDGLVAKLVEGCRRLQVPAISVLDPVIAAFGNFLGAVPSHRIGGQHALDAEYFKRIEAMDWALNHDDGQQTWEIEKSDVILVGVSRTSKTPTCLYLANRGIKAANVPFVPGVELPAILDTITDTLIIGLTNDPKRLVEIRRARLSSLHHDSETAYVDPELVRDELVAARRYFNRRKWPIINVTRRSIEETATAIVALYTRHLEKSGVDPDTISRVETTGG